MKSAVNAPCCVLSACDSLSMLAIRSAMVDNLSAAVASLATSVSPNVHCCICLMMSATAVLILSLII